MVYNFMQSISTCSDIVTLYVELYINSVEMMAAFITIEAFAKEC